MRRFSRKFQLPLLIAALLTIGFSACQKDNVAEVIVPSITAPGLKDGKDTIAVGDTRILRPQLANSLNPTFLWLVNGVVSGKDSTFTFTPTERGDYTISFKVSSGNSLASYFYRIKVIDKYDNGFYIVNEGWFTHEPGEVNFYRYGEDTIHQKIFQRNNPGKTLGTTTDFGVIFNRKLYLVSKQGPLVVTDAFSMKETGRIAQLPAEGNAFCGVDNNTGLISTANGIYPVNLQTLTVGARITGINGKAGSMLKAGNYIFVMTETDGIFALNPGDFSIAQKLMKADMGLSKTPDGTVWAGAGKELYGINAQTLAVTTVSVPFDLYGSWDAWNATMISASTNENAIFLGKTNPWGTGGNDIYKYVPGNPASLQSPFISLPAGRELTGAALRYNPANNSLVVTGVSSDYKQNTLFIYNAMTGATLKTIAYSGYFFPAMPVLN